LRKIDDFIDERQIPVQQFNRKHPLWEFNYYDHVIRNGRSYENIVEYIRKNPEKWDDDFEGGLFTLKNFYYFRCQ